MRAASAENRAEMQAGIEKMQSGISENRAKSQVEIAEIRRNLADDMRRQNLRLITVFVSVMAIFAVIIKAT